MKKFIVIALLLATLALSVLGLVACSHTHTLERHEAVDATCETDGNIGYWYCTECEKYFSDAAGEQEIIYSDTVLTKLGHDLHDVSAVDANCTQAGNKAGQQCSRCDYTTVETLPALTHDMKFNAGYPATCTEDGMEDYWTCSREDGVYYVDEDGTETMDTIIIPAIGHDMEHHAEVPATCTEKGIKEYWTCSRHEGIYYANVEGTETHDDLTIDELGHAMDHHAEVAPTCTEIGVKEHWTCSREDGVYYVDEDGSATLESLTIDALGHDMTHHAEVPATCTATGVKEYWTCSRHEGINYANEGGTATYDDLVIGALGHDMTYHATVAPTCTETGVKGYWTCSRDNGVYYANANGTDTYDDLTIGALGHDMTHHAEVPATCTATGVKEHWTCSREADVYYANEAGTATYDDLTISAIGHDWDTQWTNDETSHWHVCNNNCEEINDKDSHHWDNGKVNAEPTTTSNGEMLYTCEDCGRTKKESIPMLNSYTFTVVEEDIFNDEDGGSVNFETDIPVEDGRYVEGSEVTVTITLNEGFGLGSIYLNDKLYIDSPLTNGTYTFKFVIEEDTTLTVEFGKLITTNRKWNLRDSGGGNFAYPWEYYNTDAALDGNGTAMLLVYDATGIDDARSYDFTQDIVYFSRRLEGTLSVSTFNNELSSHWLEITRQLPEEERQFDLTLAFAIRLLPSEAKRAAGYVASDLVLPTATTVSGVDYDMTVEYHYSKADLSAISDAQFRFTVNGDYFELLRTNPGGNGSVFTTYHAAYIEVEMTKGDKVYYFYLFNEDGTLYAYSTLDKSDTRRSFGGITNAYITTNDFNNWAKTAFSDDSISASEGWKFRTKIHVDENSTWLYDGEWSEVIQHYSFSANEAPSFKQFDFNGDGGAMEFLRLGGKGLLFTQYHAAYVEIEIKKDGKTYTAYLFNVDGTAYLYASLDMEGEGLNCNSVGDAYAYTTSFNAWASKVFEGNFRATEWEYRTKVHVDENSVWDADGDWSDVIKFGA